MLFYFPRYMNHCTKHCATDYTRAAGKDVEEDDRVSVAMSNIPSPLTDCSDVCPGAVELGSPGTIELRNPAAICNLNNIAMEFGVQLVDERAPSPPTPWLQHLP